jgi:hypothetical protein
VHAVFYRERRALNMRIPPASKPRAAVNELPSISGTAVAPPAMTAVLSEARTIAKPVPYIANLIRLLSRYDQTDHRPVAKT